MSIKVLDQNTINQIAAGEVIDRPSSVVKELVENAIDAGSTIITVEIKDGGVSLIRITDNGYGIEKEDIKVAFLRHSTSKIRDAVDLLTVSSLGFRGEALSSIAAVAMVELMTKRADSLMGVRYVIEGGEEKAFEEVGVPDGTTFVVRNLFFNTPARRKFLKSAQTEAGYISDIVERIALSHPEISLRFIVNGQTKLHTPGNGNLKDTIYNIFGREITANLLEINVSNEFMKLKGFLGKPIISRGNRVYENYFINGRYIKNSLISKGIEDAYKSYIMQHKYPFTVLHIEIDQSLLDVNVHPSKMELRFRNAENIYPFIVKSVSDVLSGRELIPEVTLNSSEDKKKVSEKIVKPAESFEVNRVKAEAEKIAEHKITEHKTVSQVTKVVKEESNYTVKDEVVTDIKPTEKPVVKPIAEAIKKTIEEQDKKTVEAPETNIAAERTQKITTNDIYKDKQVVEETKITTESQYEDAGESRIESQHEDICENQTASQPLVKAEQTTLFDDVLLSEKSRIKHILVGQVFDTYWIVQYGESMYIIDQHAAHEKVLYERLMARLKTKKIISQTVNPPIIISLSMSEEENLKKYMSVFTDLGYEIEHFGGNDYCVRAIPHDLLNIDKKELFMEIMDTLSQDTGRGDAEMILEKVASMSCKAAVKGNNRLSVAEANELIDELLTLENPYNCPHGRPTIINLTKTELEKKFKRIV